MSLCRGALGSRRVVWWTGNRGGTEREVTMLRTALTATAPGLFREPAPPPQSMHQTTGPNRSLRKHGSWLFWELTAASPPRSRNVAILVV